MEKASEVAGTVGDVVGTVKDLKDMAGDTAETATAVAGSGANLATGAVAVGVSATAALTGAAVALGANLAAGAVAARMEHEGAKKDPPPLDPRSHFEPVVAEPFMGGSDSGPPGPSGGPPGPFRPSGRSESGASLAKRPSPPPTPSPPDGEVHIRQYC